MIKKRYFIYSAALLSMAIVGVVFFAPTTHRLLLLGILYLLLLGVGLTYYQVTHRLLEEVKQLDMAEEFRHVVATLARARQKGYQNFVLDSYLLYAHYMLGEFYDYQNVAKKMMYYRAWQRPRHQGFRAKVVDNLACIAFLETWAKKGELNYHGTNVILIQAIAYYKQNDLGKIQFLLENHHLPKLRRACLYALVGNFQDIDKMYETYQAKELFEKIKGRENHG